MCCTCKLQIYDTKMNFIQPVSTDAWVVGDLVVVYSGLTL